MKITHCRLCEQLLPTTPILELPATPIANEFLKSKKKQEVYPLNLVSCNNCHAYQLNYSVPAEVLFNENYPFVTGTSPVNREYFAKYAKEVTKDFNLKSGDFVFEIASNDSTFLKEFKNLGMKVLGIDPAIKIANQATKEGIETIPDFFTEERAKEIIKKYGNPKVIIANNVLAHVDNLNDIIRGVKLLLGKDGIFIFENSYFKNMYENNLYDLIYHEHKNHFLVHPLNVMFENNEMCLFDVKESPVHGGSIRCFVSNQKRTSETVGAFIDKERELGLISHGDKNIKMRNWKQRINKLGSEIRELIKKHKELNYTIDIFGYPAKLTTMLYAFGLDQNDFRIAYDHNKLKQNVYSPGLGIKVVSPDELIKDPPQVLFIGAWNFANSIIEKCRSIGYKNKFIIPLPELKMIE